MGKEKMDNNSQSSQGIIINVNFCGEIKRLLVSEETLNSSILSFLDKLKTTIDFPKTMENGKIIGMCELALIKENTDEPIVCQSIGYDVLLKDTGIKDGDTFYLRYDWGRKYRREDLFWIVVEYNSHRRVLEICEGESIKTSDLLNIVEKQGVVPQKNEDDDGCSFVFAKYKKDKYSILDDNRTLKDNKVKCGDTLSLFKVHEITTNVPLSKSWRLSNKSSYWLVVENEGRKCVLEIADGDEIDVYRMLSGELLNRIFDIPSGTYPGQYVYTLAKKEDNKYLRLVDYLSLKKNKVKCGDTLTLIQSDAVIPDDVIKRYETERKLTPNGEGIYVKTEKGYDGPFTKEELSKQNLSYNALVTNTPQYNDWMPMYYLDLYLY